MFSDLKTFIYNSYFLMQLIQEIVLKIPDLTLMQKKCDLV
jgi:hypothetical protein